MKKNNSKNGFYRSKNVPFGLDSCSFKGIFLGWMHLLPHQFSFFLKFWPPGVVDRHRFRADIRSEFTFFTFQLLKCWWWNVLTLSTASSYQTPLKNLHILCPIAQKLLFLVSQDRTWPSVRSSVALLLQMRSMLFLAAAGNAPPPHLFALQTVCCKSSVRICKTTKL